MNKNSNFKSNSRPGSSTIPEVIMFVGIALITCLASLSASGREIKVSDFQMRETEDDGSPRWHLHGEEAQIDGANVEIENFKIRLFQENTSEPAEVSSPHCTFNRTNNIGRSAKKIEAISRNMFLEGKGYDFFLNQQIMDLRGEVRMIISHGDSPPFPEPPKENNNRESRLNEE